MTVLALATTEQGADYRGTPVNDHGKLRFQYFNLPATSAEGEANSTIDLCELPPGRVRVIPNLSRLNHSALGSGVTLDIGHTAYESRDSGQADPEAADPDAFADGLDVSAAGSAVPFGSATKFDVYSRGGVLVQAIVLGGVLPAASTLSGFIAYIYE